MDAAKRNKEEEASKVGVVTVAHARVDPGTVVVHLHDASTCTVQREEHMTFTCQPPKCIHIYIYIRKDYLMDTQQKILYFHLYHVKLANICMDASLK